MKAIQSELKAIKYYLKYAPPADYEQAYQELHPDMRKLVNPLFKTIEQVFHQQLIPSGIYLRSNPEISYETNNHEIVRSKSEKIIADKLLELGIPYVYEPKIVSKSGHVLYPDFACVNFARRKIIYWEHLGMLDKAEYVERQFVKLEQYKKVGIIYGDNLFFTFETSTRPLQTQDIMNFIEQFLLK